MLANRCTGDYYSREADRSRRNGARRAVCFLFIFDAGENRFVMEWRCGGFYCLGFELEGGWMHFWEGGCDRICSTGDWGLTGCVINGDHRNKSVTLWDLNMIYPAEF